MICRKTTGIFVLFVMLISSLYLWAKPEDLIAYPAGFRNWNHVRSALIGTASPAYQEYGGLHHIYANANSGRRSADQLSIPSAQRRSE